MQAISDKRITEKLWIIWNIRLCSLLRIMRAVAL